LPLASRWRAAFTASHPAILARNASVNSTSGTRAVNVAEMRLAANFFARGARPATRSLAPALAEGILAGQMGKSKISATGQGYVGETMVHRASGAIGIVETVLEAQAGWPPEITLKLADGAFKKGKLSDFREPSGAERKKCPPPEPKDDDAKK
jgi:hypothetical protein